MIVQNSLDLLQLPRPMKWAGEGWLLKRSDFGLWHDSWADGSRSCELTVTGRVIDSMLCLSLRCIGFMTKAWRTFATWYGYSTAGRRRPPYQKAASHCVPKNVFPTQSSNEWHMWHSQKLWQSLTCIRIVCNIVIQMMIYGVHFIACLLILLVRSPLVHLV